MHNFFMHNRVNPNHGGIDHLQQERSPWKRNQFFSENAIIRREHDVKKGRAPDSFLDRQDYEFELSNFLHHERRILNQCIANLKIEIAPTVYNGNGYSFCLLDAEFCYFLLTSNRKAGSFFSRLKCGKLLKKEEVKQFLKDFSAYLIMQHNCPLKSACEDPTMCEGSFFLPFLKKQLSECPCWQPL